MSASLYMISCFIGLLVLLIGEGFFLRWVTGVSPNSQADEIGGAFGIVLGFIIYMIGVVGYCTQVHNYMFLIINLFIISIALFQIAEYYGVKSEGGDTTASNGAIAATVFASVILIIGLIGLYMHSKYA